MHDSAFMGGDDDKVLASSFEPPKVVLVHQSWVDLMRQQADHDRALIRQLTHQLREASEQRLAWQQVSTELGAMGQIGANRKRGYLFVNFLVDEGTIVAAADKKAMLLALVEHHIVRPLRREIEARFK